MCCDPSVEPPQGDGSNDGSQICFDGEMWIIIPKLSLLLLLIWSTALIYMIYFTKWYVPNRKENDAFKY